MKYMLQALIACLLKFDWSGAKAILDFYINPEDWAEMEDLND